jgi:XTP/dITP diphosphohydrolase
MFLTLASNNKKKMDEIKSILKNSTVTIRTLNDIGYTKEIEETGSSFTENALIKARTIYKYTKGAVISDDSGICIDYLDGAPGIYSARFLNLKTDNEKNSAVLKKLENVMDEKRKARFVCVIIYIDANGAENIFEGICEGKISHNAVGKFGFGYDPIFIPDGFNKTMAEIDSTTKNRISHRGIALKKLKEFLSQ